MNPKTHELTFTGSLLERGFWLYVWEITTPENNHLHYVGRTGDSSSSNAQSPFNRMGQHLGSNPLESMLRNHLKNRDLLAEKCHFRLIAHGPILNQAANREEHIASRDIIAGLEKALGEALIKSGYDVLNTVKCRKPLNKTLWDEVRGAFAQHFPALKPLTGKEKLNND
jgi:hypothetical protein